MEKQRTGTDSVTKIHISFRPERTAAASFRKDDL